MKVKKPQSAFFLAASLGVLTAQTIPSAHGEAVPPHGVVGGNIEVVQLGFENDPSNISISSRNTVGDFRIRESANRGDYDVQIGEELFDDVDTGVLITTVSENGRDNFDPIYFGINFATSHADYARSGVNMGGYFIPVAMTWPNANSTAVVEYNMNVGAAWFPYSNWIAGFARNATGANGGPNDLFTASAGLELGIHFLEKGGGQSVLDLTTLGIHAKTDGVLLVTGAKNEDNFALSHANDDGTWTIYSKDNGTDGASTEQDPIAFVFVPKTNSLVVSGRFNGNGSIDIFSGAVPQFTIDSLEEGRWGLKIPGRSPDNGVLIVSPEGGLPLNRDNIVTYQANDARDGWIIESRDLPGTFPTLETPGDEPVASFVFIPGALPGVTVTPSSNLFTSEDGDPATFSIVLDAEPTADVFIALASSNPAEGSVFPEGITFTPFDWNLPQTVTVTGADDATTDGPTAYSVVISPATSSDLRFDRLDPIDPGVINLDNEAGITVFPSAGLVVTEAGETATFSLRLNTPPTADVTVDLSSTDSAEVAISPSTVTFTTGDWDQEKVISVSGLDDFVDDGDKLVAIITSPAISTDSFYNGRNPSDVTVTNTDDDTAAVTITPASGISLVEAGAGEIFTVVLNSQPQANVVVAVSSGDDTESSVTPATVTFTASTWSTPQTITINPVDDLLVDGSVLHIITNSLTSTDLLYAGIDPVDLSVTTFDNEPVLTVPSSELAYGIGSGPIRIASRATIQDPYTADLNGATLTVSLLANSSSDDRLEIQPAGDIALSGNTVTFGSLDIGTVSGGTGSNALEVTFNASATSASVESVLRSITFRNASPQPSTALRTISVEFRHADGGQSTATRSIRVGLLHLSDFQEGADHGTGIYTGTADTELYELRSSEPFPAGHANAGLWIDWRDPDSPNSGHVLLRFDNIIGDAPGQIPTNARIVSADLILDINDSGDASPLHRMLIPWDAETVTWDSIGGGVFPDDFRARVAYDSQIGVENGSGSTTIGTISVSVTPDIQAWVEQGEPNYGWVMPAWPLNLDGTGFSSSEAPDIGDRPRLRVLWLPPGSSSLASFRHGVNDYLGAFDTRIRHNSPDTEYSTVGTVFVDAQVSAGDPNPEQVLLRFDSMFGDAVRQIPAGSRIEAAILDLASVNSDGMGDGGQIFALLQPWTDLTSTWNSWVDGIQFDGIEALISPSAVAGSPSLNPDVQGGFLAFDLTADVQAWSSGTRPNEGWVITPWPGGGNGWGFTTSEAFEERHRPRLRVYYTANSEPLHVTMQAPVLAGGQVQIHFTGSPGETYSIWRTDSIGGAWSKLGTSTTESNGSGSYSDATQPAQNAFYRLSIP